MQPDPLANAAHPESTGYAMWMRTVHVLWLCVLGVGVVEIIAHFVLTSRVPADDDWAAAAEYVRETARPGDILVAAPAWTEPLMRRELGDTMTLAEAGPSDYALFARVTEVSTRGHRDRGLNRVRPLDGSAQRRFGAVTVRHYVLGPSPVVFDLTSNIREARVTWEASGRPARVCQPIPPGRRVRVPDGRGGLGAGAMVPAARAHCDSARPWMWVGETVIEDLSLRPRHCVWQHPAGGDDVIAATYDNVPLGGELVLYAGLYSEHERMREHTPFEVRAWVNGHEVGTLVHRDGDGWKRMVAATLPAGESPETAGTVRIEVRAENPHLRAACWAATLRAPTATDRVVVPPLTTPAVGSSDVAEGQRGE